jgi:hypothetical protein
MSDDYRSMVAILKRLPSTCAALIRARIRGDENLPSVSEPELQASLDKLTESDRATIRRVIDAADARNAEANIAQSWDDECDAIELEIDAGLHDDIDEKTVEVLAHRTMVRVNRLLDQHDPIDAALNAPSELVFDDDDEELD